MKLLALHKTYYTQESKGSLKLKSIRHLVTFQKLNDTSAVNEMNSFWRRTSGGCYICTKEGSWWHGTWVKTKCVCILWNCGKSSVWVAITSDILIIKEMLRTSNEKQASR